jgi:hypothetical protein
MAQLHMDAIIMSEQEIEQLLDTAESLEEGPTKVSVLEQAIRLADSYKLVQLGFEARKSLIAAGIFCGMPERSMPVFAWCLQQCDENPQQFDEVEMLWEFKWILSNLKTFANVSMQSILGLELDFERRLSKNGYSLRPLHELRMERLYWPDQQAEKDEAYRLWNNAPRDSMANCFVCEENSKVEYLLECRKFKEGIKHGLFIIEEGWRCYDMPHRLLGSLLLPLVRLRRFKEAEKLQERGYRLIRNNRCFLFSVGQHLRYFAHTGQLTKGFNLLKRHLDWAWESYCDHHRWYFFSGAALFLDRCEDKSRKISLPDTHPLYDPSDTYRCSQLSAWFRSESKRLAELFDHRNGVDHHRRTMEEEQSEIGKYSPR